MFTCIDTYYYQEKAIVAGVVFHDITSEVTEQEYILETGKALKYQPGYFYLRELPGIMEFLGKLKEPLHTIIIDGYVWLSLDSKPGLGAHLYRALNESIPVIGVAKTPFKDVSMAVKIYRGKSRRPLYITAAGMKVEMAARLIEKMHGQYRIPTMVKHVDALSRGTVSF